MKIKAKEATGGDYLSLALYAFGCLGIEMIYAFLIEPMLWGGGMENWTTWQTIVHWIITCATWYIGAYIIVQYGNRKYNFNIWESIGQIKRRQWIAATACGAFVLINSYLDWNGFKVIKEFENLGLLKFCFQYIYYMFETVLFLLIIVFGQKALEKRFKNDRIPYGGIVVALTWGMAHWFTKGSFHTGIITAIAGFCFGAVYLLLNRNVKWTYVFLFLMFAL